MRGNKSYNKAGVPEPAALLLASAVTAALVYSSHPLSVLAAARAGPIVVSAAAFGAGAVVSSIAWVLLISPAARGQDREGRDGFGRSLAVSLAGMLGNLTPMSLGTDIRRARYARIYIPQDNGMSAVASSELRRFELHSNIASLVMIAASFLPEFPHVLALLCGGWSGIGMRRRLRIYALLAGQLLLELVAFASCCAALRVEIGLPVTFRLYLVLRVLARIPALPQGMGLVELGGLLFLYELGISQPHGAALLLVWDAVRLTLPVFLGLLARLCLSSSTCAGPASARRGGASTYRAR